MVIQKVEAHIRYVIHVSFSHDGLYLVSASNDKMVKLWALKTNGGLEQSGSK